ncbi:hypothetical protein ACG7TL_008365 [Trametes sanguinea]
MCTVFSVGKGKKGLLRWSEFIEAMRKIGFAVTTSRSQRKGRSNGSMRVFIPGDGVSDKPQVTAFSWDHPHGRQKDNDHFDRKATSRLRKLLSERYGWDADTFFVKRFNYRRRSASSNESNLAKTSAAFSATAVCNQGATCSNGGAPSNGPTSFNYRDPSHATIQRSASVEPISAYVNLLISAVALRKTPDSCYTRRSARTHLRPLFLTTATLLDAEHLSWRHIIYVNIIKEFNFHVLLAHCCPDDTVYLRLWLWSRSSSCSLLNSAWLPNFVLPQHKLSLLEFSRGIVIVGGRKGIYVRYDLRSLVSADTGQAWPLADDYRTDRRSDQCSVLQSILAKTSAAAAIAISRVSSLKNIISISDIIKPPSIQQSKEVYHMYDPLREHSFDQPHSRHFTVIQELMETDMRRVIHTQDLSDDYAQYSIYETIRAFKVLHSDVTHRDLTGKPSNLLLKADCDLKLMAEDIATGWYRASEITLTCKHVTKAIDTWSWSEGCALAEMLSLGY